jgi:hypothetical protein
MKKARSTARAILITLLVVLAVVSLAQGVRNAMADIGSQDFQYSASLLMLRGQNAYQAWESNRSAFLLSQGPNYLPLLYLFLTPFAVLPWGWAKLAWAIFNVSAALWISYRVWMNRFIESSVRLMIALLFLSSLPVRNTLGNGQQGLLVTLALVLLFSLQNPFWRGLCLAVATTKYSIGAFFLGYFAGSRRANVAVIAIAGLLVGYLCYAAITGTKLEIGYFLAPVKVAGGMGLYPPFSILRRLFGHAAVVGVAVIGVAMMFALSRRLRSVDDAHLSSDVSTRIVFAVTLSAMALAPHAGYDGCVLIIPFVFFDPLKILGGVDRVIFLALLAYLWNGFKVFRWLLPEPALDALGVLMWLALVWLMINSLKDAVSVGRRLSLEPSRPAT